MQKSLVAAIAVLALIVSVSARATTQVAKGSDADVAAITKIENDGVKADLANDPSFFNNVADDWTGGTSRGTWDTKQSVLADMKDTKNNKFNSEKLSDLKVRVHGDVAIATYTDTYDATIKGTHYTRSVITTDTFQRQNGVWKVLASHSSQVAQAAK